MKTSGVSRREFLAAGGVAAACICCPGRQARGAVKPPSAAGLEPSLVSACGIYCGACPAMMASTKPGIKTSEIKCLGCWNTKHEPGHASKCEVRKCAKRNNVRSCGQCRSYPCKLIPPLFNEKPKYGLREKNLNEVRDRGLEAWLASQKKRWTCPACGKPFGHGATSCPSCGGRVLTDAEEFAAFKQR